MISRKLLLGMLIAACCSLSFVSAAMGEQQQHHQHQSSTRKRTQTQTQTLLRPQRQQQQHRRRAMGQSHSSSNNKHRYHDYGAKYYTQGQRQKGQRTYRKTEVSEASLADVWLCYAFALGWSMWFLSSFLNTDLMRFAESESVLVHGNVREVSIEDDDLGTGIPTYHALIDYIITVRREAVKARIHVRKAFQTQHLLQQGFANVELLVLPEEPTSSVLKEDWQREVAAQDILEEDIISIGGGGGGGTTVSITSDHHRPALTRVDIWAKRTSLFLSGTLVMASLIGAVLAVHRIQSERMQFFGWVSIVLGSVLLWPMAMFSLRIASACQRLGLPNEKSGIILRCDTNAQAGASGGGATNTRNNDANSNNNTNVKMYMQHQEHGDSMTLPKQNTTTRHINKITHAGTLEKLTTTLRVNNSSQSVSSGEKLVQHPPQHQQLLQTLPESDAAAVAGAHVEANSQQQQQHHRRQASNNTSSELSACYFVRLPSGSRKGGLVGLGMGTPRLDDSSLSTISADSRLSKSKRNSASTS